MTHKNYSEDTYYQIKKSSRYIFTRTQNTNSDPQSQLDIVAFPFTSKHWTSCDDNILYIDGDLYSNIISKYKTESHPNNIIPLEEKNILLGSDEHTTLVKEYLTLNLSNDESIISFVNKYGLTLPITPSPEEANYQFDIEEENMPLSMFIVQCQNYRKLKQLEILANSSKSQFKKIYNTILEFCETFSPVCLYKDFIDIEFNDFFLKDMYSFYCSKICDVLNISKPTFLDNLLVTGFSPLPNPEQPNMMYYIQPKNKEKNYIPSKIRKMLILDIQKKPAYYAKSNNQYIAYIANLKLLDEQYDKTPSTKILNKIREQAYVLINSIVNEVLHGISPKIHLEYNLAHKTFTSNNLLHLLYLYFYTDLGKDCRICKREKCQLPFLPSRSTQIYCCAKCRFADNQKKYRKNHKNNS